MNYNHRSFCWCSLIEDTCTEIIIISTYITNIRIKTNLQETKKSENEPSITNKRNLTQRKRNSRCKNTNTERRWKKQPNRNDDPAKSIYSQTFGCRSLWLIYTHKKNLFAIIISWIEEEKKKNQQKPKKSISSSLIIFIDSRHSKQHDAENICDEFNGERKKKKSKPKYLQHHQLSLVGVVVAAIFFFTNFGNIRESKKTRSNGN